MLSSQRLYTGYPFFRSSFPSGSTRLYIVHRFIPSASIHSDRNDIGHTGIGGGSGLGVTGSSGSWIGGHWYGVGLARSHSRFSSILAYFSSSSLRLSNLAFSCHSKRSCTCLGRSVSGDCASLVSLLASSTTVRVGVW